MRLEIGPGPAGPRGSRARTRFVCGCALALLIAVRALAAEAGPGPTAPERGETRRFRITVARSEHGGILPSHPLPVAIGGDLRLGIFPSTGYHLDSLFVDGVPVRRTRVLELRDVRAPHHVAATFAPNEYVILATAGRHVTIVPSGVVPVPHGRSQSFLFAADSGYKVSEVLVDGSPVRAHTRYALSRYTFANVRTHHRITARIEHHAATVIAPEPGELWLAGETREVRWQPLEKEEVDSAEVRISYHGADGPWEPIWRGLFRTGAMEWTVPPVDCDSLMACVATIDTVSAPGVDYSSGFVTVRSTLADGGPLFYVRATPSPAPAGPVRLEYSVPVPGEATLEIYTVSGREVWRRPLGFASTGRRSTVWDGKVAGETAEPGVYFARLSTRQGERNCRLVLLP